MAYKWASSLANIEARIARSLGIAGPIGLALEDPPRLVPVAIADDLTRPGCVGTNFRGRRFAVTGIANVAALGSGCVFFVAAGLNTTVGATDKGGVVLDEATLSWSSAAANERIITSIRMSAAFETQLGVSIRDGIMVDPIGEYGFPGTVQQSPMLTGTAAVTHNGVGGRIWECVMVNGNSSVKCSEVVKLDVFLREQSYISFGNSVAVVGAAALVVTLRGRVF